MQALTSAEVFQRFIMHLDVSNSRPKGRMWPITSFYETRKKETR